MTVSPARSGRWRAWLAGLPLFLLPCLLLTGCAGVLTVPCDEARVSNLVAPTAYVVKLPFTLDDALPADGAAARLDQLLELQSIVLATEVSSTHLTLLRPPGTGQCDAGSVYRQTLSQRAGLIGRRLYNSAIFVWGDVFEHEGVPQVQFFMRMFWNGRDAVATVRLPSSTSDLPFEFVGRLPASTITFPRRPLRDDELARLGAGAGSLRPRLDRTPDARREDRLPRQFVATDLSRDGWIQLTTGARTLWLSKNDIVGEGHALVPELAFVEAVTAYLDYNAVRNNRSAGISLRALRRFEDGFAFALDPRGRPAADLLLPLAIGDLIKGSVGEALRRERAVATERSWAAAMLDSTLDLFGQRQPTITSLVQASDPDVAAAPEEHYRQASSRAAADSDVLTLSALALLRGCCNGPDARQRADDITALFETARRTDVGNADVAGNLLNWYRWLAQQPPALRSIDGAELARRAAALSAALQR